MEQMPLATHANLVRAASANKERLPALACISVWFAISGGIWVAIIAFLGR